MNRTIVITVLLGLLLLPLSTVSASGLPSCEDLTEIANALDDLGEAFDNAGTISEGGEVDTILGDLVTVLEGVAKIENNASLSRAVRNLANAWDAMNADSFATSLEDVTVSFDALYNRDCN